MKKLNKKVIVSLIGAALMVAAVGSTSVFAADGNNATGTTDLSYTKNNVIPSGGDWGLIIPSTMVFHDKTDALNMNVSITALNGATLLDALNGASVDVSIASANGNATAEDTFSLKDTNTTVPDPNVLSYTLKYDSITTAQGAATVSGINLTAASPSKTGTAKLVGDQDAHFGTALEGHTYKDTLTYTATRNPQLGG